MPVSTAEQELLLDGDPEKNLATFVTTWMGPDVTELIGQNLYRNFIDHAEYPQTAEIEQRRIRMLADLFNAPGETIGALARIWTRPARRSPRRAACTPRNASGCTRPPGTSPRGGA